jgi:transcription antitermination factor NusG
VSGLVRFGSTIPSLSSDQLNIFKNWVSHLPKKDCFLPGQLVHMIAGPLRGLRGIFEKLTKEADGEERAIIFFEIFGKTQKITSSLDSLGNS